MKTKSIITDPATLTPAQMKQLELVGMVIVGDRIIRTAASIKRTEEIARKSITTTAKRLFKP